jgi:hypothetical protein
MVPNKDKSPNKSVKHWSRGREPCGQLKVGNRVDYGWALNPTLVQFFTRFFVPSNAYDPK